MSTGTATRVVPPVPAAVPKVGRRWTWDRVQRRGFAILRWVVIVGLLLATLVPFYYMLLLSVKPIEALLRAPGSLIVRPADFTLQTYVDVLSSTASGGGCTRAAGWTLGTAGAAPPGASPARTALSSRTSARARRAWTNPAMPSTQPAGTTSSTSKPRGIRSSNMRHVHLPRWAVK